MFRSKPDEQEEDIAAIAFAQVAGEQYRRAELALRVSCLTFGITPEYAQTLDAKQRNDLLAFAGKVRKLIDGEDPGTLEMVDG